MNFGEDSDLLLKKRQQLREQAQRDYQAFLQNRNKSPAVRRPGPQAEPPPAPPQPSRREALYPALAPPAYPFQPPEPPGPPPPEPEPLPVEPRRHHAAPRYEYEPSLPGATQPPKFVAARRAPSPPNYPVHPRADVSPYPDDNAEMGSPQQGQFMGAVSNMHMARTMDEVNRLREQKAAYARELMKQAEEQKARREAERAKLRGEDAESRPVQRRSQADQAVGGSSGPQPPPPAAPPPPAQPVAAPPPGNERSQRNRHRPPSPAPVAIPPQPAPAAKTGSRPASAVGDDAPPRPSPRPGSRPSSSSVARTSHRGSSEDSNQALEALREELEAEHRVLKKENRDLKADLDFARNEVKDLREELEAARDALKRSEEFGRTYRRKYVDEHEQLLMLQHDYRRLQEELADLKHVARRREMRERERLPTPPRSALGSRDERVGSAGRQRSTFVDMDEHDPSRSLIAESKFVYSKPGGALDRDSDTHTSTQIEGDSWLDSGPRRDRGPIGGQRPTSSAISSRASSAAATPRVPLAKQADKLFEKNDQRLRKLRAINELALDASTVDSLSSLMAEYSQNGKMRPASGAGGPANGASPEFERSLISDAMFVQ